MDKSRKCELVHCEENAKEMKFEPQGLSGNAICDDRKPKEKPQQ